MKAAIFKLTKKEKKLPFSSPVNGEITSVLLYSIARWFRCFLSAMLSFRLKEDFCSNVETNPHV